MSVGESGMYRSVERKQGRERPLNPLLRRVVIVVLSSLLVFQFGELKEATGDGALPQAPLEALLS